MIVQFFEKSNEKLFFFFFFLKKRGSSVDFAGNSEVLKGNPMDGLRHGEISGVFLSSVSFIQLFPAR